MPLSSPGWLKSAAALCALLAALAGCAGRSASKQPLATSLHEIVPHHDRDHFVYLVERATPDGFQPSGMQVEHVSKLQSAGEFEVTLSEDGMKTGSVHIRDDGQTLWLISEDDYTRGIRMLYDPPLPYLSVPLFAGEVRSTSSVTLRQLADGQSSGRLQVTQVSEASAAPAGKWLTGTYRRGVRIHTQRTLLGPDGNLNLGSTTILVPGIGDVQSEGEVDGAPGMRRALACAIIGNQSIGDCRELFQRR